MRSQVRAVTVRGNPRRQGWLAAVGRFGAAVALVLAVLAVPGSPAPAAETSVRLAVIANPGVPLKSLGASELAAIFTRATRTWKDGTAIRPLNLQPGSPERVAFDRVVLHMDPEQSAQFWVDRMVRGEEPAPKAVAKADIVLRLVPTLGGGIAYIPEDKVDDKVKVLAFVRDGKVVAP
jgi:hypothetical protein